MSNFLCCTQKEMKDNKINQFDFIIVTGDAYIDHPSFGTAIISRVLENEGYLVGIISQPKSDDDYKIFGYPKYAFMVNSGNMDSMVAKYTVAKIKRDRDMFTPLGKNDRPDYQVIHYCKNLRKIFGDTPIVIGGIEASLRRFAHYDYWSNSVMPSILIGADADLLSYGMGERTTIEIAKMFSKNIPIHKMTTIRGTCFRTKSISKLKDYKEVASFEKVKSDKVEYAKSAREQIFEQDHIRGKRLIQRHGDEYVVQNPPQSPLSTEEMDKVYSLPYMRNWHPKYDKYGGIEALNEVLFSITHVRGCFGCCNFCALTFHQGRTISKRSKQSILNEVDIFLKDKRFKGYIHDVGGPTANFRNPSCLKQQKVGACDAKKCLTPSPCKHLIVDHSEYLDILNAIRSKKGVKKVFIRSGIRFDYLMLDKDESFFKALVKNHISGHLKVAPEHICDGVLSAMGKPKNSIYNKFSEKFYKITKSIKKEQYLIPYLMSSHPGSTINDAIELALYLKKNNLSPKQVQDFYPTPGSVSTVMYYTGINPLNMQKVYVAKSSEEKKIQRAFLQYSLPKNRPIIEKALIKANRADLIGYSKNCLITPSKKKSSSLSKDEIFKRINKANKRK